MVERTLQGFSGVMNLSFSVDGTDTDPTPDEATVIVTNSAGDVLYTGSAADEDTGLFSVPLTPTHTAELDTLTATWSITYGSLTQTIRTQCEVVGGFLFTLGQARALDGLNRTNNANQYTYSTDQILEARVLAETTIEDACDRSFVPRFLVETLNGSGTCELMLSRPDVRALRSITVDGTAYTVDQLGDVAFSPTGLLTSSVSFTRGARNVVVAYEHGCAFPPPRVSQAALRLARSWIVVGPIDDRTNTFSTTEGGTYSLIVPGQDGSVTGLPEVDAVIQQYSMRVGVA